MEMLTHVKTKRKCTLCINEAKPGYKRCQHHIELIKIYSDNKRKKMMELGLCVQCRAPKNDNKTLCAKCNTANIKCVLDGRERKRERGDCIICPNKRNMKHFLCIECRSKLCAKRDKEIQDGE